VTSSLIDFLKAHSQPSRPEHYRDSWPIRRILYHRHRDTDLEHALAHAGYRIVFCAATNEKLAKHQERIETLFPWITTARFISKAQHLRQRLLEIGVDFHCEFYESASPYGFGGLNKSLTLQNLELALVAKGFRGYCAETLFEQEYEQHESASIDGASVDVLMFTNARFLAMLNSYRRTWWSLLGYKIGTSGMTDRPNPRYQEPSYADEAPPEGYAPPKEPPYIPKVVGHKKILVLFDDPPAREFDERRLIQPQHVQTLLTSPKHVVTRIGEDYFEERPEALHFCRGLERGYCGYHDSSSTAPKLLISSANYSVIQAAETWFRNRTSYVRLAEKTRRDWNTLALLGLDTSLP
jgi:hypothetical protein